MRVSQAEKDRSHQRIVAAASRLIRERGLEGASVAQVMTEAGLTHGGFYRHFETKDALLAEALRAAFAESSRRLTPGERDGQPSSAPPKRDADDFPALYLSRAHLDHPGVGCPVAALGTDIGRASDALKAVFGAGVRRMVSALAQRPRTGGAARRPLSTRKQAIRDLAMLVGALVIARASDPDTASEILEACGGGGEEPRKVQA